MDLKEIVRKLCEQKGMTAQEFEKVMGFSNGYVGKLNKSTPNAKTLQRIADYFGVSLDFLLSGEENHDPDETAHKLPVLGIVRAGKTQAEYTDIIDYIKSDYRKEDGYFGLMVKGDSMQPRIYEGDIVIVRSQPDAENGEIVVAQINGDEACVKKLIKFAHGIALQSLNPAYPLLQFSEEQMHEIPVIILGKVVEARARF